MCSPSNYTDLGIASLTTEARHGASLAIDSLSAREIVELMNAEDATVADAVRTQLDVIATAVDVIADRLRRGGRLVYMGAGTSGRLGVLDATECPPTFDSPPEQVIGLIAGGREALVRAVEGAEDRPELGDQDLEAIHISGSDVVVGIATSGRTPYVMGGLAHARQCGAYLIGLTCNADTALETVVDLLIAPVVGPEIVTGSTRLKAGTATKMVLNMLTTGAMVRLGKTYGNLLVDLHATNQKLFDRSRRIVMAITGVNDTDASGLLRTAQGELKTAIVMYLSKTTAEVARQVLADCQGNLRAAIEAVGRVGRGSCNSSHSAAMPTGEYVLGVDGGGSKTVAWLAHVDDPPGAPLGRGCSGPSNPQSVPEMVARQNIRLAIAKAFEDAGVPAHRAAALCLAIAGAGREDRRNELLDWARSCSLAAETVVTTDAEVMLDAIASEGPTIVLIAGTGSLCLGRDRRGSIVRGGGWGYLMGDEGSGYAIGIAALRECGQSLDGRNPDADTLRDAILADLKVDSAEAFVRTVYKELAEDRRKMARLAPVVVTLAEHGDPTAREIVYNSAEQLAELVGHVYRRIGGRDIPLLLSGGLLVGSAYYRDRLLTELRRMGIGLGDCRVIADSVAEAVRRAQTAARKVS